MKRHNTAINELIQQLRSDKKEDGVESAIQAFSPTSVKEGKTLPWRIAAVAAGAVVMTGVILMLPQRSAAAALNHVVLAHQQSAVMFHLTAYDVSPTGKEPKIWSGYAKGNRWHYVQSNFEQSFDGTRTLTYIPERRPDAATSELGSEHGSGQFLVLADLAYWKKADPKKLSVEHNVSWQGRSVDRYVVLFASGKGEGKATLYVDPKLDRPLYEENIQATGYGSARAWEYFEPAREDLLTIHLPAGTKIREVVRPKTQVPLGPAVKASRGQ